jgi:hypothetical protein
MLSIPATKAFEIGSGFRGTEVPGSKHNDAFIIKEGGGLATVTNWSGGVQGGISNGEDIYFRLVSLEYRLSTILGSNTPTALGSSLLQRSPRLSRLHSTTAPQVHWLLVVVTTHALCLVRSPSWRPWLPSSSWMRSSHRTQDGRHTLCCHRSRLCRRQWCSRRVCSKLIMSVRPFLYLIEFDVFEM